MAAPAVILVSILLCQQPHSTLAERRTDEVRDAMMNNINEQQEDAVFTSSGSTTHNGSDTSIPEHKNGEDPLERDMNNAILLAEQVQVNWANLLEQRNFAQRTIDKGVEDTRNLYEQISKLDQGLKQMTSDDERCSSRIGKAEKELANRQRQYEELITKVSMAILCVKGGCTQADSASVSTSLEEWAETSVTTKDFDTEEWEEVPYTTKVDVQEGPSTTEVDVQEGPITTKGGPGPFEEEQEADTTKESIPTSTFLRQPATTSNIL